VAKDSRTNEDNVQKNILFDSNREALIPTLKEFQRRIEHLATYLEDLEQESLSLRSAAQCDRTASIVERNHRVVKEAARLKRLDD
jgi:hypothetical protein